MRVTGGSVRGTPLTAPKGSETRPTTDRVREAIFSILYSMGADLSRVLDLYAGSGALAIEALSRGDGTADLVERAPVACEAIRRNLSRSGLAGRARLHCTNVLRALERLDGPYTLILLDPPYADLAADGVLMALGASPLIGADTVLVLEHGRSRSPPSAAGALALQSDRRYGDTGVAFYAWAVGNGQ